MDVNDILVFVRVVQAGSFSQAARNLNMPVSTVSRRVAELEKQLGVPLLHRTTRSLKITDVGAAYFKHGRAIAAELEKTEALVGSLQAVPQGILKITAPIDFGNRFLGKILNDYLSAYPEVQVNAELTERIVDLIDEGFDLGIRIGELSDSSLHVRKLGTLAMRLYASPEFIQEHGEPRTCSDLEKTECIRFTGEDDSGPWELSGPEGRVSVRTRGRIASNNLALVHDFAVLGRGIALLPRFFCTEDLRAGRLRIVLKEWMSVSGPIHAVFPGQRLLLPKVRTFVDHLTRHFSSDDDW
jgi:DNA-binding transcriptional LysR family regulator